MVQPWPKLTFNSSSSLHLSICHTLPLSPSHSISKLFFHHRPTVVDCMDVGHPNTGRKARERESGQGLHVGVDREMDGFVSRLKCKGHHKGLCEEMDCKEWEECDECNDPTCRDTSWHYGDKSCTWNGSCSTTTRARLDSCHCLTLLVRTLLEGLGCENPHHSHRQLEIHRSSFGPPCL